MRREILHGHGQERAAGHQEIEIEDGKGRHAPDPEAQHRHDEKLKQRHRRQLAAFHDLGAVREQPDQPDGHHGDKQPCVGFRQARGQRLATFPDQIGGDRQNQEAVIIGGGLIPHLKRANDLYMEDETEGNRTGG